VVGPTVSSELAWVGTIGVIASLFAMLLYIWVRFEWQFGVGAIVSTLHDVVLMIGLYVVFGFEFNLDKFPHAHQLKCVFAFLGERQANCLSLRFEHRFFETYCGCGKESFHNKPFNFEY
ncbi:MAG TPA: hypothetical protein PLY93_03660, partial [Turneriella sp.]|nr:hypothetical protein [Turneriella sp.]